MQNCRRCSTELINLPATNDKGLLTLCTDCRENYKRERSDYKKRYYLEVIIERRNKDRPPRDQERAKRKEAKRQRRILKRHNNLDETRRYHREWRNRNKEKSAGYQKKYIATKANTRFAARLRTLVYIALKNQSTAKTCKMIDLIGCSIEELQSHLSSKFQPGMTWENHGRHGWHIDHIKPCSKFDLTNIDQQKKCFHYSNLQPLWAKDNIIKSNKVAAV